MKLAFCNNELFDRVVVLSTKCASLFRSVVEEYLIVFPHFLGIG